MASKKYKNLRITLILLFIFLFLKIDFRTSEPHPWFHMMMQVIIFTHIH